MKAYATNLLAEEDGPFAEEFKTLIVRGTREELSTLCSFFAQVQEAIESGGPLHLHYRDHVKQWDSGDSIDIDLGTNGQP